MGTRPSPHDEVEGKAQSSFREISSRQEADDQIVAPRVKAVKAKNRSECSVMRARGRGGRGEFHPHSLSLLKTSEVVFTSSEVDARRSQKNESGNETRNAKHEMLKPS